MGNCSSWAEAAGFSNYFASLDPRGMSLPALQRNFDLLKREYESSLQVVFLLFLILVTVVDYPYILETQFLYE